MRRQLINKAGSAGIIGTQAALACSHRPEPLLVGNIGPQAINHGAYAKLPADFDAFPHLHRWHQAIATRPATQRAYAIGPTVNPNAGKPLSEEERRQLFGQR